MNHRFILVLALLIFIFNPVINVKNQDSNNLPIIDGHWSENEWPDSIMSEYSFTDNVIVQFGYRVNETHLFFTSRYLDETPTHNAFQQDAFAIGFDNNGDQTYMGAEEEPGKPNNPDDAVFVGLNGNYSIDVYMQGIGLKVVTDESVGGTNDTSGKYSLSDDNYYTYEFVKAINSGDTKGKDISLKQGDSIKIMLAYWDNLPPFSEISGYSRWITLKISDPLNAKFDLFSYILPVGLSILAVIALVFFRMKTSKK